MNLNTIARAYREMEIRGIVETQQGTGTFVSARKPEKRTAERRKALERLVDQFLSTAAAPGIHARRVRRSPPREDRGSRQEVAHDAHENDQASSRNRSQEAARRPPRAARDRRPRSAGSAEREGHPGAPLRERREPARVLRRRSPSGVAATVATQSPWPALVGALAGVFLHVLPEGREPVGARGRPALREVPGPRRAPASSS